MGPMYEDEYQAEMDMRTLKAAEEIEMNPKRKNKARQVARQKAAELIAFAEDRDGQEDSRMVRDGFRKL